MFAAPLIRAMERQEFLNAVAAVDQSASAMAVLGSDACVRRLREGAAKRDGWIVRSNRVYQALRALVLLGDVGTIRRLLDEWDMFSVGPGVMSGGTLPLWWLAP